MQLLTRHIYVLNICHARISHRFKLVVYLGGGGSLRFVAYVPEIVLDLGETENHFCWGKLLGVTDPEL